MKLTYGDGNVNVNRGIQAIKIRFRGSIDITASDNWVIGARNGVLIGVYFALGKYSGNIFQYSGEFEILSANSYIDSDKFNMNVNIKGVDHWNLDKENWTDDNAVWGSANKGFIIGKKPVVSKSITKNVKVREGDYLYKDGSVVHDIDVHIYNNGVVMTGSEPSKDSVRIYPNNKNIVNRLKNLINMAKRLKSKGNYGSRS